MPQQQEMSFAKALNDAKQVIVQQSGRIKADADKIRNQQQTIVDQAARVTDADKRLAEQAAELQRQTERLEDVERRLEEASTGRAHAEAVIDSQGQRLTAMQAAADDLNRRLAEQDTQIAELTARIGEQDRRIADLTRERDELAGAVPTQEDAEALAAMAALLTTKKAPAASAGKSASGSPLRIVPAEHAEAA